MKKSILVFAIVLPIVSFVLCLTACLMYNLFGEANKIFLLPLIGVPLIHLPLFFCLNDSNPSDKQQSSRQKFLQELQERNANSDE